MSDTKRNHLLELLVKQLELPDGVYEKAINRYKDLGEWVCRDKSLCEKYEPHIFAQGSFRLGTAIRPIGDKEEYDLDIVCELQSGISKSSYTQSELKSLIGSEIINYAVAKNIKSPVEEKHRCWRLDYADDLTFHIDIIPCITEVEIKRNIVFEAMKVAGEDEVFAHNVSDMAVSITDDRLPHFNLLSDDWLISNPEGYAKWFEKQMHQEKRTVAEKLNVENIPTYKRKTPLQRAIQLLKRHRDQMFKDDLEVKPISIIITTLAAKYYRGENEIHTTLQNILFGMLEFINSGSIKVLNPVNPDENFADRWTMPQYKSLNLQQNFVFWVKQAQNDFDLISTSEDMNSIAKKVDFAFSVNVEPLDLKEMLGLPLTASTEFKPKEHTIDNPAKPWRMR